MRIGIAILCLLLLTGCWDRREITEIGIVAAMAIDKDKETGEYVLTSEFLRPAAESTQTPTPDRPFLLVTTTGKTIYEVMRKANQTTDRTGFFAHNKVIVISEEVAKEGIIPIIDSFQRGKEVRGYVWLSITKGVEAKKPIEIKANNIARIPANYLQNLIDNNAEQVAVSVNILNFYKRALAEGVDPVATALVHEKTDIEPFESIKLSGAAVFQKDKLKGFLNESETRGLNWITGEGPKIRGTLSVPSTLEEGKFVTVLLQELRAKIKPEVNGKNISYTIDIEQEGRISELQATGEFKTRKEIFDYVRKIEKEIEQLIEKEVKAVVNKAQTEFQADIFGFGKTLNREHPKIWNEVKANWVQIFPTTSVTVNVSVNLTSTGLMKGPFDPK
ncbi:Ger(x)C family spore germination protein [Halalkalibacter urbisdiaboli]|uniref:Ger(x)C family spore germination protein n=1 Tax=Halalkalibacter urbisdiaboli TaxID=1960589 RepID=UPI000B434E93|nr:Ger(x)C family spore germination protein [Halalkalibacter urbisdiaboli]